MPKTAVFNDTHGIGYQIACWMFRDLGYEVYVAGESFRKILPHYYRGSYAPWAGEKNWCSGVMEWADMPADALFIDTFPETEGKLRAAGFTGPYLIYWILPVWPDFIGKSFSPGKKVGVLAFNYGIGREISERRLCPVEFFWPPYHEVVPFKARETFDPFIMTVIKNLRGWSDEPLCTRLRDNPKTRLELFGGGPPEWSREIPHDVLLKKMARAVALFHPKPTDTPGYAVMEAMLQGVPVILMPDFLRSTEYGGGLYEDGKTFVLVKNEEQLLEAVERLKDPVENRRIGLGGRERLLELAEWKGNRGRLERLVGSLQ